MATTAEQVPTTSAEPEPSGWIIFAAIMLFVAGTFSVIWGLAAILNDQVVTVGGRSGVILWDFTAWGWIWLILGLIQLATGAGIIAGRVWARVAGVLLAVLAAIGQLAFLRAFPVWSVLVIGLCVVLVHALTAHPRDTVSRGSDRERTAAAPPMASEMASTPYENDPPRPLDP